MKQPTKVGLTGGIATGKSTTLEWWRGLGAVALDADEYAHRAMAPRTPAWAQIVGRFGNEILNPDGTVNRPKLGDIVFADDGKREALNRIVHPTVDKLWKEDIQRLSKEGQARIMVVAIPLLYEVAAEAQFDCVVAVACSEQIQLSRLTTKGLTEAQSRARIHAQWPLATKMDRADFVIWNEGTLTVLHQQADIIWATIKETYYGPSKN